MRQCSMCVGAARIHSLRIRVLHMSNNNKVLSLKNILVLFDADWDQSQLAKAAEDSASPRYRFFYEGFDLFSFPSNVQLLTFDIFRFVDKLAKKYRSKNLDGMVSNNEPFGPPGGAPPGGLRAARAVSGSPAQIRALSPERLAQAWLVPRWIRMSPARITVSSSSMIATSSPCSRMA